MLSCTLVLNIQSYFLQDNKALESQQLWQQILASSTILLDTFDANRFSQAEIDHGRQKYDLDQLNLSDMCRLHEQRVLSAEHAPDAVDMDVAHDNGLDEATHMGCKYLTSS